MKIVKMVLIGAIFIIAIKCSKLESLGPSQPQYWGNVNASLNGNIWQPIPYCRRSSFDHSLMTITMDRKNSFGEMRQSLEIVNIPKIKGKHSITDGGSNVDDKIGAYLCTMLYDGDVFGDIFRYDSTLGKSYIDIMEWDSINGHVGGFFDIKLLRSNLNKPNLDYPDTLRIAGAFKTKYN